MSDPIRIEPQEIWKPAEECSPEELVACIAFYQEKLKRTAQKSGARRRELRKINKTILWHTNRAESLLKSNMELHAENMALKARVAELTKELESIG